MNKILIILFLISAQSAVSQTNGITIKRRVNTGFAIAPVIGNYTLPSLSTVSAGIYKTDGTLVRTLFSGVAKEAGTYPIKWDGTDDTFGVLSPDTSYIFKSISNNVQYTWEGARIGNTSDSVTGPTKWVSYDIIQGMAITGTTGYAATGYAEGGTGQHKFSTATPNQTTPIFYQPAPFTNQATYHVATDGINVYWGGYDAFASVKNFVFATKVSDDTEQSFSSGSSLAMTYGRTYGSAIDYVNNSNGTITGMAVQESQNFLFVSHSALNELHVLNKTTGAIAQTITTFTNPRQLACDNSGNLWVISGTNTVSKYSVNASTGALTSLGVSITGTTSPIAIGISKDNSTVIITDAGSSQQVKGYSNADGSNSWILGTSGGYTSDPTVSNSKFYFSDVTPDIRSTFVATQSDGSFWVGDPGNYRSQHYASDRSFLNRIMFLPRNYSVNVVQNDSSRLFSEYLEFAIDYSKTLDNGTNGSWSLVRNWRRSTTSPYYFNYINAIFKSATKMSNGRTYGLLYNNSNNKSVVVELPSSGGIRFTGIELSAYSPERIYPDGSLRTVINNEIGGTLTWSTKPLSGFDGAGNPTWGSSSILASTTATTARDPVLGGAHMLPTEITSSSVIASFSGNASPYGSSLYHLGGMSVGSNKWLWKTSLPTHTNYYGAYPVDGSFDVGNGSQFQGNVATAIGRSIIWGYNGESWKGQQVNKWQHFYDNGLLIGQFGTTGPEGYGTIAPPMMAGNSFSPAFTKVGSDYYLYLNDESYHSGVHRWKITGLNTIQEQSIPLVSFARGNESILTGTDLMVGLPFDSALPNNTNGWVRFPAAEDSTNIGTQYWRIKTNVKGYGKRNPSDLYVRAVTSNDGYYLSRDLGSNVGLSAWTITGKVSYEDNFPNLSDYEMFLEVLDDAGKVLLRFYTTITFGTPNVTHIYANSTLIADISGTNTVLDKLSPISLKRSGSGIEVAYAGFSPVTVSKFDATGNVANPKNLRIYFHSTTGSHYTKIIDVSELRFYPQ